MFYFPAGGCSLCQPIPDLFFPLVSDLGAGWPWPCASVQGGAPVLHTFNPSRNMGDSRWALTGWESWRAGLLGNKDGGGGKLWVIGRAQSCHVGLTCYARQPRKPVIKVDRSGWCKATFLEGQEVIWTWRKTPGPMRVGKSGAWKVL